MIDTSNEDQLRVYNDKLKILRNQINENGYNEDNLKIVITANMFPEERTVLPSGKESYVYKNPNCSLGIVVRDRIDKVDGIDNYDDNQLATLKLQSEKYMPYNSKYVSVVYAAINGLYPDYYATNYIIVDSFKEHIANEKILSMRPETTLFTGAVTLTNEAVILIKNDNLETFSKKYPELNRMNVITFKGDPTQALSMYLVNIGIVPEKMTKDFVVTSPTSFKFNEYINQYSATKKIPLLKYEELGFYESDQKNTETLEKIYDATFYDFLLKAIKVPEDSYQELFKRLCDGDRYDTDNLIILDGIIDSIGAQGLIDIVNSFNSKIDELIKEKKYPVNEQIIENGKIELI